MISLQNSLNVSKSKFKNKDIDILEGINKANNSVLKRACILKGIVKDRSIGPTSSCKNLSDEDYTDSSPTESFATSTPDQSLNGSFVDSNEFNDSKSETALPSAISNSSSTPKVENNSTPKLYTNGHSNHDNNFSQRKKLYNKKLKEFEEERKNLITVKVRQKVQLMMKEELKIQEEIEDMKHELQLARAQLEIERTQKLLREEEDIAYEAQQWKYVNEQRCNQRLNEANERIKKALQKQQEAEERQKQNLREKKLRLDKVHEYQILYRTAYQQLQEVIKTCKDNKNLFSVLSNEAVKLKSTNERFEMLVENCKGGHVSQKDIENGEDIVKEIKEILHLFKKEVDAVNLRHENAIKAEEEKLKIKSEQKIKPEVKPVPNSDTTDSNFSTNDLDDCVDKDSLDAYLNLKKFLASYEESLKPLLKDDTTKKFRFACQRAINIPVNAISPYSREHMQDKYMRLFKLLKGQSVDVSNSTVTASSHPLGIQFCTNLLAKKFVSQGEHTVSSKPEAAFAIAGIIVSLWTEFPDFGTLLLAHFQQECPYLIPAFMPQIEGQSNEDYYKILGYRYIDGKVESQDKFLKRMSGVMRLYAAIIVTQQHPRNVPHPLGLREGWRWLAASINLGPRTDITATLILDVLEVAGFELMNCYGVQFQKLLHLLCTDFFALIEKVTPDGCGGPVRRLKTFLEKICKENKIMPPVGLLPKHIW